LFFFADGQFNQIGVVTVVQVGGWMDFQRSSRYQETKAEFGMGCLLGDRYFLGCCMLTLQGERQEERSFKDATTTV